MSLPNFLLWKFTRKKSISLIFTIIVIFHFWSQVNNTSENEGKCSFLNTMISFLSTKKKVNNYPAIEKNCKEMMKNQSTFIWDDRYCAISVNRIHWYQCTETFHGCMRTFYVKIDYRPCDNRIMDAQESFSLDPPITAALMKMWIPLFSVWINQWVFKQRGLVCSCPL